MAGSPPPQFDLTITIYFLVMGIKEATGGFPYIRRCHAEFSIMVFVFRLSPYLQLFPSTVFEQINSAKYSFIRSWQYRLLGITHGCNKKIRSANQKQNQLFANLRCTSKNKQNQLPWPSAREKWRNDFLFLFLHVMGYSERCNSGIRFFSQSRRRQSVMS